MNALASTLPAYKTPFGASYVGDSRELLKELPDASVSLVLTSPPFALQRKKSYGNKDQHEYIDWLAEFCELVKPKLKDDGSLVIDVGGAYEKGKPVRSLYNFRIPIKLCDDLGFFLAEDFYWHNPSRLPGPVEWVNKKKFRATDAVNTIWWFSKTERPKADVRRVLLPYSKSMKKLLENPDKYYKPGKRPGGHGIGLGFGKDNGGAIPDNLLTFPNTESNSRYIAACKATGVKPHPARFPSRLPEFFIRFLTEPGDLVLDIFAGSNTTGQVAETEGRNWLAFEQSSEYVAASAFRFSRDASVEQLQELRLKILAGGSPSLGATAALLEQAA